MPVSLPLVLLLGVAACTAPDARPTPITASFEHGRASFSSGEAVFSLGAADAWTCGDGDACARHERVHGGVTEWWTEVDGGFEHGFELDAPDALPADGLTIPLVGVDHAVSNGSEVALFGADGLIASYRDPRAFDAAGRALPIQLRVDDGALRITLDTTDAAWPVLVDPVLVPAARTITGLAGDHVGQALARGGDVNRDGFGDLLVGARDAASAAGRAWTWHGSAAGLTASPTTTLPAPGGTTGFGAEVVGNLDVNGDGFGDAVVSPATGPLQVYLGAAGGLPTSPSATLTLASNTRSIAAAGDVNRDGFGDLAVTLCTLRQTLIYAGSAAGLNPVALSTSGSTNGGATCSTTGVGDVNRDTFADVVVGDPTNGGVGRWMLFLGSAAGLRATPAMTANGAVAGRSFGAVVVGLGDVNGDTRPDLAVTSPNPTTLESTVYAYYSTGTTFSVVPSWTFVAPAGDLVSDADAAGDVDADGYADLVFGSRFGTTAWIVHGSAGGLNNANATLLTGPAGWSTAVAGVGDVNGDTYGDVAVGDDTFSTGQGRVYVFAGMRDADRDGFALGSDCNDTNAAIFPGATEITGDGIDQDCDGGDRCLDDDDNDGFLDASGDTRASADLDCADPFEAPLTDPTTDCDDFVATTYPGAPEVIDDHIDQNCQGGDDCYRDDDDDGYRPDATATVPSPDLDCNDAHEAIATDPVNDCNDLDSWVRPGTGEPIGDEVDQNCDGVEVCYADADNDGFVPFGATVRSTTDLDCRDPGEAISIAPQTDCDDTRAAARPGAPELTGTGVDENCDGAELCFLDADDDGRRPNTTATRASTDGDCADSGEALSTEPTDDCNDAVATVYAGATEVVADGVDQDCNGGDVCFTDADNDGFRPLVITTVTSADLDCADAFEAVAADPATDCNDAVAAVRPNATEVTGDGVDQNCDGGELCFLDADDDGVRPNATATLASADLDCADPREALTTDATTDCNDADPLILPGVFEIAGDGVDQNCDGRETCYDDDDDDGFIDTTDDLRNSADTDCADPFEALFADPRTDCNDALASIYPGATEVVGDGVDQNCDGGDRCWADADDDGYRPNATASVASLDLDCTDPFEAVAADPITDCNDAVAAIRPGVFEIAGDNVDQDCNGSESCFVDADDDGHIPPAFQVRVSVDLDCADPTEALETDPRDDCNDASATVYLGAPELIANGIDESCDTIELCYDDDDDDGFLDASNDTRPSVDLDCADPFEGGTADPRTDCDDAVATTRPGAAEVVDDGIDQSCDGGELCWLDNDDDGFRPNATATLASADLDCDDAREARSTDPTTDCNDSAATIRPGAAEVPGDEVDQDCDTRELCYADADSDTFAALAGTTVTSTNLSCRDPGEALATAPRTDCNDSLAAVRPNAAEITGDGLDQNCDNAELCYLDADSDGFRPNAVATVASADLDCTDPGEALGTAPITDCNDNAAIAFPGGTERPGDNIDGDCSGRERCYVDADDDGYRNTAENAVDSLDADCNDSGEALVTDPGGDCNDFQAAIRPNATEIVGDGLDQDCTGGDLCFADGDDDGFRPNTTATVASADLDCLDPREATAADPTTDCNDADATIRPGATEVIGDEVDQSCDGAELCFDDDDDDGVLDTTGDTIASADADCRDAREGTAADARTDCDDALASVRPGAAEVTADGVDQDCDGGDVCWLDQDDDGFRPLTPTTLASVDLDCADPREAVSADPATDCDDGAAAIRPNAAELPGDEVDQNCDRAESCFDDDDDDGFLDASGDTRPSADLDCADPFEGRLSDPTTDCADTNAAIAPGATELVADGVDSDCTTTELCWADADRDGFASIATVVSTDLDCADPGEAAVTTPADCDDTTSAVRPGGTEVAGDGVDADCDGAELCFRDADADGFRPGSALLASADADCDDPGEARTSTPTGDCDDADAARSPAATELPGDALDQDCDGGDLCFVDADADGFRTAATVASPDTGCADPGEAPASAPAGDCDDQQPAVYPGAVERPANGRDDDCDRAELCFRDADDDGFRPDPIATTASADVDCDDPAEATAADPTTDCDDTAAAVFPGAAETPGDAVDQDCDGGDRCFVDADRDGFRPDGGASIPSADLDCADPGEAPPSAPAGDCDDAAATTFPGATERPADGADSDCDRTELCFVDADGDGFRPGAATRASTDLDCADPGEAIGAAPVGDCDDAAPAVFPGATEAPGDGVDGDCDGGELCFRDDDVDGYRSATRTLTSADADCADRAEAGAAAPTDCDDAAATVNAGATERPADGVDSDCDGRELCYVDADNDGFRGDAPPVHTPDLACAGASLAGALDPAGDCRDDLPDIRPGVVERCDGLDQDCDGLIDDGVQIELWSDLDGDTWGDPSTRVLACAPSPGFVPDAGDCAPNDPDIHPYATDVCDGVNQDCDDDIDEDAPLTTWYADRDRDRYGDPAVSVASCGAPIGFVDVAGDCDDADGALSPVAPERCNGEDDDCDGVADDDVTYTTWYADGDGDGFGLDSTALFACDPPAGSVLQAGDCDDADPARHPQQPDLCDEIDNDCDAVVDEDSAITLHYVDLDGDGYGQTTTGELSCDAPVGTVTRGGDCDDARADVRPGALETCDRVDNDCDAAIDEDAAPGLWFDDADGDGWGGGTGQLTCSPPAGWLPSAGDCDDGDPQISPDATERAGDSVDQDCDGAELCVGDADGDGNGAGQVPSADTDCADPGELTDAAPVDCDDADRDIFVGAPERCNGLDDDCDRTVDDGLAVTTWYADGDDDGYGAAPIPGCVQPPATVARGGDCDDTRADISPAAIEQVDGVDGDCDGQELCLTDADRDGAPTNAVLISADADCDDAGEALPVDRDCDDADAARFPGAAELCDGVDQDCDGDIDEGASRATFYADLDQDGYGDAATAVAACVAPAGAVVDSTDCDDDDAAVFPGAADATGDGVDGDCDGAELCFVDADADGARADLTRTSVDADCDDVGEALANAPADCDDADADVLPGATELPGDDVDQDCDGAELCFVDADGDGWRPDALATTPSADADCADPGEALATSGVGDCDDAEPAVHPGAPELPNGRDDDCDGAGDLAPGGDADADGLPDAAETGCTDPAIPDTDGDGLLDGAELTTDPCAPDTDADGVGDGDEAAAGTDPVDPDSDADGLDDGAEAAAGTDPLLPDTDADGLGDGEEAALGADPLQADTDADGLGDAEEAGAGTDPANPDTDGDGLSDGDELGALDTDPTRADSDEDGVPDGDEVDAGTAPNNPDSDADGMPDGAEASLGTDPLAPDTDGDGVSDGDEVEAGTDPTGDPPKGNEGCGCDHGRPSSGLAVGLLVWALRRRRAAAKAAA